MAVCLAIDRRCGQPDFQAVPMSAFKGIGRGPGLDMHGQNQVFSVPLVPRQRQHPGLYPYGKPLPCLQQGAVSGLGDGDIPGTGSCTG